MLDNLRLFLLIVERNNMAAAGRELGLSPATVSSRLASLERHFGVRLLHRTTRSLAPSEEGLALVAGARRVLAEMQELDTQVRLGASVAAGMIRVSAPVDLGRNWFVPLIDRFMAEHPNVLVDVHLSDGFVDVGGGGFDIALRLGELRDSTLRARRLGRLPRVIVASPDYLERAGTPQRPADLQKHECLLMRFGDDTNRWWPCLEKNKVRQILVHGRRTANDGELVRRWCLQGQGLARKSFCDVASDLEAGRLIRVLQPFEPDAIATHLVFPGGSAPPRRVQLLSERIVEASSTWNTVETVAASR